MRICIAYYTGQENKKIIEIVKSLAKGIEQQTNSIVDMVDISKESDKKLTGYSYILFGCVKDSLFNTNIPKKFIYFIRNCGHITGKHTFAFTQKGILAPVFLSKLMTELEREGVLLKTSSIISSSEEAKIIGSKLHIK